MNYSSCELCPRRCLADRQTSLGFCRCGVLPKVARAALHLWEEPCISGRMGSGTVFFSGCTLKCCFCQNYAISSEGVGKEITPRRLGDIFLELEEKGAHNINLVTPTQYLPSHSLRPGPGAPPPDRARGLQLRRYERTETIQMLDGYVDIYLPDLKYRSSSLSARYSAAPDYFLYASQAIPAMIRQVGAPVISEKEGYPLMERGVIILPHGSARAEGGLQGPALLGAGRPAPGQLPHQHSSASTPPSSGAGNFRRSPPDHHLRVPAGGGLRRGAGPHGGIYAEKKQRPGGVHAALRSGGGVARRAPA